jgi:hypothetical protein
MLNGKYDSLVSTSGLFAVRENSASALACIGLAWRNILVTSFFIDSELC